MRVIRMRVAYDGTDFHGWQMQPGLRTVQGALERALGDVLGAPTPTHAAGRTDAGVHARGQVASFESATPLPERALAPLLNRALPGDVRVRDVREAPAGFHARHSARARRYAYRLLDDDDVLFARYAWRPAQPADAARLGRATAPLEGEHDFSSFQSAGSSPANPRCRMTRARWSRWEGGLALELEADHFLYHMVRNVVGTALACARADDPAGAMRAVLEARDRRRAGVTVPPQGLCLEAVRYDEDPIVEAGAPAASAAGGPR